MAVKNTIRVQGAVLKWARGRAGLSVSAAEKKIGMVENTLATMETEGGDLTLPRLEKMSKIYRQSLLVFYLPSPPKEAEPLRDFRTLPACDDPLEDSFVRALQTSVQLKQSLLSSLCEDASFPKITLIGSLTPSSDVKETAQQLAKAINFDLRVYRKYKDANAAVRHLRNKIESAGIFVFSMGNLGNFHSKISVKSFRGIALPDPIAPCLVVNANDSALARVFTMLHELVHLGLNIEGVSGEINSVSDKIERFCDSVASEMLLPSGEFPQCAGALVQEGLVQWEILNQYADDFNVSRDFLALRIFKSELISYSEWKSTKERLALELEQFNRDRKARKDQVKMSSEIRIKSTIGFAATKLVSWGLGERLITPTKANLITGLNPYSTTSALMGGV